MEGLPQSPGILGALLIVFGAGLAVAFGWWARSASDIRSAPRFDRSAILAIVAACILLGPYVGWRIVEDVRYTSALNPWIVDRYGISVVQVHPAIFDAAAARIPLHARYYLATAPTVDSTRRQGFEQWAAGWLLPRIATSSPSEADWVLTLGVRPKNVGPPLIHTWRIWPAVDGSPAAYLGEVRR